MEEDGTGQDRHRDKHGPVRPAGKQPAAQVRADAAGQKDGEQYDCQGHYGGPKQQEEPLDEGYL